MTNGEVVKCKTVGLKFTRPQPREFEPRSYLLFTYNGLCGRVRVSLYCHPGFGPAQR
jgi:hypothetical protein